VDVKSPEHFDQRAEPRSLPVPTVPLRPEEPCHLQSRSREQVEQVVAEETKLRCEEDVLVGDIIVVERKWGWKDQEWEVEDIIGRVGKGDQARYLVKWHGFAEEESSWEPFENLANCMNLVLAYEAAREAAFGK
jgi:hypothetical protein